MISLLGGKENFFGAVEMVEVESYLEDIGKLQEELANAENALNREREREKGISTTLASCRLLAVLMLRSTDHKVETRS